MNIQQAQALLANFAVVGIGRNGNKFFIEIGNCGPEMNKVRKFRGADLQVLVCKIFKTFE